MKSSTCLKIAGGFSFFFFLFHIPFYWVFNWKESLSCLSADNWAIVMCFNIITITLLFFMAYVSLIQAADIIGTQLGKSFLAFSTGFYLFRIAAEFIFFDEPNRIISAVILLLCLIPAVTYSIPLFKINNRNIH